MIMTMMVMMIVILPSSSVVTSFLLKAHPESGTFSVYACSISFDNYPNVVCSMYCTVKMCFVQDVRRGQGKSVLCRNDD